MMSDRAWVLLPSGRRLDLLAPDPEAWTDRDLAIRLSRTYRWGGQSLWEMPLSVAQHSLLVLVLRQQMQPFERLTRAGALRELLHDAEEGLLGFDPITPIKPHLGGGFRTLSEGLQDAIATRYGVTPWGADDFIQHKKADRLAASSEALHVAGWSLRDIHDSLRIDHAPLMADPLPALDGLRPWEPWPSRLAAALFLAKLEELMRTDPEPEHPACLAAVVNRERTIQTLAARFAQLPPRRQRRCRTPPTGSSLSDTLVFAEADDGSQSAEGVVVDAERDEDGQWDFETEFTLFTSDEQFLVCHGYNCHVDIQ